MNVKRVINSELASYFLLFLVFVPLLFINVRSDHDWGGDFAQYINQAKCICEGKSQAETGYIFNDQNPYLGPPVYPVGFPLLLAPVYLFFGNSIFAFLGLISVCLFLLSILLVKLNEFYFNRVLAIIFATAFVYNPWLLTFKAAVLSDIPFALFFILSIYFYKKYFVWSKAQLMKSILLGFLICFSILLKSIGIAVLLGIFLDRLITMLKTKTYTLKPFFDPAIASVSMLFFYVLFNYILFPSGTEHYSFFLSLYDFSSLFEIVKKSNNYYFVLIKDFFSENVVVSSITLSLFLLGFIRKILSDIDVLDLIFIPYFLIVLFFPAYQGFRYLLPVFPLIIIYIVFGIRTLNFPFKLKNRYLLPLVLFVLFSDLYVKDIWSITESGGKTQAGPQANYSIEAFNFIRNSTDKSAVFAFVKPRVLALYTSRQSIGIGNVKSLNEIDQKFSEIGVDYIVETDDLQNQVLDNYINSYSSKLELIWENSRFKVYKMLDKH